MSHWVSQAIALKEYDGMSFSSYKEMEAKKMLSVGILCGLKETFEGRWKCAFKCAGENGPATVRVASGRLVIQEPGQSDRVFSLQSGQRVDAEHGKVTLVDFIDQDDPSRVIRLVKLPKELVSDPTAFTMCEIKDGAAFLYNDVTFTTEENHTALQVEKSDLALSGKQSKRYEQILEGGSPLDALNFARRHPYASDVDMHALSRIAHSQKSLTHDQAVDLKRAVDRSDLLAHPRPKVLELPQQHSRYQKLISWPARTQEAVWLNYAVVRALNHAGNEGWEAYGELRLDLDQLERLGGRSEIDAAARIAISELAPDHPDRPGAIGIQGPNDRGIWTCEALDELKPLRRWSPREDAFI